MLPSCRGGYGAVMRRSRKLPDLPTLDEVLRDHALHVLEQCNGSGTRAARALGIDRKTLYSMLRRWRAQGAITRPTGES